MNEGVGWTICILCLSCRDMGLLNVHRNFMEIIKKKLIIVKKIH